MLGPFGTIIMLYNDPFFLYKDLFSEGLLSFKALLYNYQARKIEVKYRTDDHLHKVSVCTGLGLFS